ncbi:MAG: tyrosine-protein phosphatase [Isosphaeraceae bacterium]
MNREKIRRVVRWGLAIGLLGLAAEQTWRHGHDYVFPEKFRTVEPGKLYRGAWQKPFPMRNLLRDYKIKTVVALAHMPDEPLPRREKELVESMGIRWIHIPIYYDSREPLTSPDVGDRLEKAAAILADPANQPVYFHCHHGVNRTSMTQIAYRTIYCRWPLERAKEEIQRTTGWKASVVGTGEEFMDQFYRTRVLPGRQVAAAESAATSR